MNEIVNKFLLTGDKFMSEMHLNQPEFGPFTKNKKRIQKFKETGDTNYIYKNELDKACFQHDMAYGVFKDFKRTTFSDEVSRDKIVNMMDTSEDWLLWFVNVSIKSRKEVVLI